MRPSRRPSPASSQPASGPPAPYWFGVGGLLASFAVLLVGRRHLGRLEEEPDDASVVQDPAVLTAADA